VRRLSRFIKSITDELPDLLQHLPGNGVFGDLLLLGLLEEEVEVLLLELVEDLEVPAESLAQVAGHGDVGVVAGLPQDELHQLRVEPPVLGQDALPLLLRDFAVHADVLLLAHDRVVLPPQLVREGPVELPGVDQLLVLAALVGFGVEVIGEGGRHLLGPLQRPVQVLLRLHKQTSIFYLLVLAGLMVMIRLRRRRLLAGVHVGAVHRLQRLLDVVGVDEGLRDVAGLHEVLQRREPVVCVQRQPRLHRNHTAP
jgi:hypothetical protein